MIKAAWQRLKRIADPKHLLFWRFRSHPFVVPVITLLVLFSIAAAVFITTGGKSLQPSDSHMVIITHDKTQSTLPTRASTVGDLLKRLNITLNEGDRVEPSADTPIVEDNFRVNVYRARPVLIIDGSHKTLALNAATTPRSITEQAGVQVFPEDTLSTEAPQDFLKDDTVGAQVVINRATPINLNLYGTQVLIRTHATTVSGLLKEKNVQLADTDTVQPSLETALAANQQVFVVRQGTQIVTQEVTIPFTTQIIQDPSLSFGATAVRQQGSAGKKLVTYQIDTQNGKETGRHVIQEVVVTAAVDRIVARGSTVSIPDDKTVLMSAAGIAVSDYPYVNYIVSHESGWCATKWQGEIGFCPATYQQIHSPTALIGYGLCQSTPPTGPHRMDDPAAGGGPDWATNPITQLHWCSYYANSRYGSWAAAYNHWLANNSW